MAFTLQIGHEAPDFYLPGVDARNYTIDSFREAPILVVVFSCNHCPYVIGSEERFIKFADEFAEYGVAMVAINSNSTEIYADDSYEAMILRAREKQFPFPYLRDESQDVARAYGALRTPHFFVFDVKRRLRYTGRMDDNPKDAARATTHELRDAVEALLEGNEPAVPVTNPLGCNVKWRGHDKKWMPPEACDLV
jgi:peroxiredoxin